MTNDLVISKRSNANIDDCFVKENIREIDSETHYFFKFKDFNVRINNEFNQSYSFFCFTYKFQHIHIDEYLKIHDYGIYKRFKELKGYKNNWDGEGALSMTKRVAKNFESLYPLLTSEIKKNIDLSLETNGTLSIEFSNGYAGLEIGNDAFTYFFFEDGNLRGKEHLPFNSVKVSNILRRMAEKS